MRFINVGIPQGSTILNAYVQFTAQGGGTAPITIEVPINGEAVDNAATFINVANNITDRPLTAATVNWIPPTWPTGGAAGEDQRTPNIASILQEIVNRPGWESDNALVIILGITGDRQRNAASFEDNRPEPFLHIEYTTSGGGNFFPNAVNDNYTVAENSSTTTLTPAVTGNDDFGGDGPSAMDIAIDSAPANGNATVNNSGTSGDPTDDTIDYTPNADFDGADSLTYTIEDSNGDTSTAMVNITVTPAGGTQTIDVSVAASTDDAEERNGSSMRLASSDLELVVDGSNTQKVGLRFNGLTIPPGATITNARIQFQADEVSSGASALTINGQLSPNPGTFTSASGNISSRPLTAASVGWSPAQWGTIGEAGPNQMTPNLASVIQEIVNQGGWSSGNSLVIIISGSGTRTAESFNGAQAPALHVEYTTP